MDPSSNDAVATSPTIPSTDPSATPEKANSHRDHPEKPDIQNSVRPQELLDRSLDFLATASNETLTGAFALLAFVTYIILGRLGLVLIGTGLGVVLHASWEGPTQGVSGKDASTPKKRRELALEVSKRLLDWPRGVASASVVAQNDRGTGGIVVAPEDLSTADLEFTTFQPATAAALRSLTDAVVKDYVKLWYEPMLPNEPMFPSSCRRTLTYFITTISTHLSRKRTEDTFLQFLTNSSSIIIVFLNELAAAFAAADPSSTDASQVVEHYLKSFPDSSLANVLSEEQQRKKLNMVADDVLSNFLDSKAYGCSPMRDFLREVFARLVLESTITSLSRPEFINDWIIYLLQDGESEIMHAIDAGVEGARNQSVGVVGTGSVSEDSRNALLESTKAEAASQVAGLPPSNQDKATEEAIKEAKRLSALIASQDLQNSTNELPTKALPFTDPSISKVKPNGSVDGSVDFPTESVADQQSQAPRAMSPSGQTLNQPPSPRLSSDMPPVTLHGARVLVDDDAAGSERGPIKSRPTWDYLLQIEPASTRATGWMVFRKYADFQSLHDTLSTVSRLNRIQSFSDQFPILPPWKGKTRQSLAHDLQRYLQEAMQHESLAETERMRRFVEKEGPSTDISSSKQGFTFPSQTAFENIGKDLLGALTNAPKGMAGGGKAVLDGVTGVFAGVGHSRKLSNTPNRQPQHQTTPSRTGADISVHAVNGSIQVKSPLIASKTGDLVSTSSLSEESDHHVLASPSTSTSLDLGLSKEASATSISTSPENNDTRTSVDLVKNEKDDCASESKAPSLSEARESRDSVEVPEAKKGLLTASLEPVPESEHATPPGPASQISRRQWTPITADETQIAVELIFAVINELYTLSSAWNIRRTLLNAAKTYILRPGSPTLETIRGLLQESMIEAHTSDEALAEYLKKIRENALPTEAELKAWPPPPSDEEKAQLRDAARRLFVQRGIPQALTSVMGAAASREALEKIFDSLQVESVARGFVFSLMLQALRVLTL